MRRIGTLTDPDLARRFADFLFTLSIECNVDIEDAPGPDGVAAAKTCNLWIRDESHVPRAKQELEAFLQAPTDEKYRVGEEAERIRKQRQSDEKRKKRLQQKVNPKSPAAGGAGGMLGVPTRQQTIPVVIAMVILSVIASFSTGFGQPKPSQVPGELSTEETIFYGLSFVDWRDYVINNDPLASIKKGQVWRLVTPLFLHGDTYHLAFNMLGIFFLGSAIERLQGSWFMAFLLLASGIFGGLVQIWLPPEEALPDFLAGLAGSPFSIGASGAVYGLFGYLWIRPALSPSYPVRMMPSNVAIMLGWLVFCIFYVERIANGAHLGGLIAGVVIAAVVSRMPSDRFA
ncbi:rhomboid family intramembrane serine protease [Stieleria mannarensis]|uniref:rhomboid family intramembrane serine protease n=1 Tax=Stieleria mannarensis TaxID=2755585 RepID=UPI0025703DBE|nr:rhomboid family intramembrane serine protease [Rhodopirellula sp. JC639]